MISNHILEDKWQVQRSLSEQAGNDPGKYIALVHKRALEAQERYGIRIRYVEPEEKLPGESLEQGHVELVEESAEHSLAAVGDKEL